MSRYRHDEGDFGFKSVSTGFGDRVADFHVDSSACCAIFENKRLREAVSDKGIFFGLEWARGVRFESAMLLQNYAVISSKTCAARWPTGRHSQHNERPEMMILRLPGAVGVFLLLTV